MRVNEGSILGFSGTVSPPPDGTLPRPLKAYFSRESGTTCSRLRLFTISRVPPRRNGWYPRYVRATAEQFSPSRLHSYVRRFNAVGHPLATTGTRDCRPSWDPQGGCGSRRRPDIRRHTGARFSATDMHALPCAAVVIYAIPTFQPSTSDHP